MATPTRNNASPTTRRRRSARVPAVTPGLPSARPDGDRDFVAGLARGLAVMLAFSQKRRHLTISQISHRTGIPRAAVRRSLMTLRTLDFVDEDDAHHYSLRPRVLMLGHAYLSASPIVLASQHVLDQLSDELRQSTALAVLDGDDAVYLARSSTSRIISPLMNIGGRIPAYCSSAGRVLLACLPEKARERYLAGVTLHAYTDATVTSIPKLRALLAETAQRGYAVASQQYESGIVTLAVPVRNSEGEAIAAISVINSLMPAGRAPLIETYLGPLQAAAAGLRALSAE